MAATLLVAALAAVGSIARAATFDIIVDTTPIAGVAGFVAFDVVDGDGVTDNTVTISGFVTDGMLTSPATTDGDATGTLTPGPAVIGDGSFFAELRQPIMFGTRLSFHLEATTLGTFAPFPDQFSFFLLDGGGLPFATTDPLGADALVVLDISGPSLQPVIFTSAYASGCAGDSDGDGICDANDNCPHVANPGQEDTGGIGASSGPDGIGDACQCGDVNGNGRVTIADSVIILRSLLSPPTATQTKPALCDVGGSPGCTLADAVIILRANLSPATAAIVQQCAPAVP